MKRSRLPMWRVTIEAHDVPPRWHVSARTVEVAAADADDAVAQAIQHAHRFAVPEPVPPWKPAMRKSIPFTTAEPAQQATGSQT